MEDKTIEMARKIARLAAQQGGTAYYIGGFVRDRLRGEENKDVDMEVHGLYPGQLERILDALGQRLSIGESFGIYSLKGYALDIAMPRREENRGRGHRDFAICVDPFIGTCRAAARRDFTVNALMENVLTGELIDHFGGLEDLKRGVLRHVNGDAFGEDPLRVLRAAQFAARFGYTVAEETAALCGAMDLSGLPGERVMGELQKALLKSARPSVFFRTLRRMGQLSVWFPELERTVGVEQDPVHHAEGDVWTHTMLVTDAAVRFREGAGRPLGFMLAAVVHDFGKVLCTSRSGGAVHAYGHETAGLPLIEAFLGRLTREKGLIRYVQNLAELHMKPNLLAAQNASVKATNRMFDRAADPEGLICLAEADRLGQVDTGGQAPAGDFLRERLAVYREYMSRPHVTGQDLIDAGIPPSGRFSQYLDYSRKLRLAGVEKQSALRQVLALARQTEGRGKRG